MFCWSKINRFFWKYFFTSKPISQNLDLNKSDLNMHVLDSNGGANVEVLYFGLNTKNQQPILLMEDGWKLGCRLNVKRPWRGLPLESGDSGCVDFKKLADVPFGNWREIVTEKEKQTMMPIQFCVKLCHFATTSPLYCYLTKNRPRWNRGDKPWRDGVTSMNWIDFSPIEQKLCHLRDVPQPAILTGSCINFGSDWKKRQLKQALRINKIKNDLRIEGSW